MFPSSSKADPAPDPAEHYGEPQTLPPFDIPILPSQFQSKYNSIGASSSYLVSAGPASNDYEPPMPLSSTIHLPRINGEQVSFPHVQRAGMPTTYFDPQGPPQYTGGLLAIPENLVNPPVPRLRAASWGPPSWLGEAFEGRRPTRSRSSVDFRGGSGAEEDLPFGGRTLPPLPALNDPWRLDIRTAPNINATSSRDHSPGSEDLSLINSLPSAPSLTNDPDREYGPASDQPEVSTSTHRLPTVLLPTSRLESNPPDAEPRPQRGRPKKPRQIPALRVSRRAVAQGPGHRDHLPEPGEVDVIECGWTGCETPIQHNTRSVKDHVRFHHGGLFKEKELLTCRWVRNDTEEECGSRLLPESLCRHTLDMHTNLIMKDCVCGKRFRRDTLGRHRCEAQGNL